MSEFGVGPEDWIEFDLDEVNRDRRTRILDLVERHRSMIERVIGEGFETVVRRDGSIGLVIGGCDVATAGRSVDDRLEIARTGSTGSYL